MDIGPTFKGYIEDENDVLLVLQATLDGKLKHIPRRPYEVERRYLIVSGSIFVFIEEISGIKRWTDGVSWSPSRISGKFLMYKELDKSVQYPPMGSNRKRSGTTSTFSSPSSSSPSSPKLKMSSLTPDQVGTGGDRRGLVPASPSSGSSGSSNNSLVHAHFSTPHQAFSPLHQHRHQHQHDSKYTGFVKKTMSVRIKTPDMMSPETLHIVSYYAVEDVQSGKLIRPRDLPFFSGTKPSQELLIAMENTSLGSHSKSGSSTAVNSPLATGANTSGKMKFIGINSTAGSMRDSQPQQQQKQKLENNDNFYQRQEQQQLQQSKPVLPNMQPLPGLRIPSLTSIYNINNNNNNNSQPNGGTALPPHPKFTRFIGSPLPNPYLSNPHQSYQLTNARNTTTANAPPPPPPPPPMINKLNERFYSFPPGYVYYGSSPHQNSSLFYPLPTTAPSTMATATQLPHPPTSTNTNTTSTNVPDLQDGTSSGPTFRRAPADAGD
ncbi:hypothetical protein ZYGR_0N03880 [Zygosaccharomyces rouxii]|uniref:Uncharacterized protein n=1 Tax=Zygosaccharomyces rouxii TaxID=4956 RepID=A0A1Q3A056_ZYGRO|nr:hypothetical protein ZYGR_0N03880 [Zygosaccharomyces rouxii]